MICLDAWMQCTSVRYDARLVKMVALAVIHSPLPIDPRQTLGPPLPETKAILPIIVGSGHLGQQRVKEFFPDQHFKGIGREERERPRWSTSPGTECFISSSQQQPWSLIVIFTRPLMLVLLALVASSQARPQSEVATSTATSVETTVAPPVDDVSTTVVETIASNSESVTPADETTTAAAAEPEAATTPKAASVEDSPTTKPTPDATPAAETTPQPSTSTEGLGNCCKCKFNADPSLW